MLLIDNHAIACLEVIEKNPNADWEDIRDTTYLELEDIAMEFIRLRKENERMSKIINSCIREGE